MLGEKNEVNPFSEDALQALFIGCVLGGIYKISDMPKNYQAQKMGTALLQSKSAANGLMEMAGGSASPEVKNALGAYRKDGSPMALGNLLMAVQKEQGLAPTVATRRGNTTVLGEAKSLEPSMEDLVAYLHEKGEMGAPSTQMYAARKRVDGLLGNGNLSADQAEWIAGTPNLAKAFSERTGVKLDGLSPAEAKAVIMRGDAPGFTSMADSGMMFDEKLDSVGLVDKAGAATQGFNEIKLDKKLLEELAASGTKYSSADIVSITKRADGKTIWLENGNDSSGLKHILNEHGTDFSNRGIIKSKVPNYLMEALNKGKIVGYQGRGTGRPIYEFTYNGTTQRVAITTGDNGYIVGANPVSIK